MNKYVLIVLGLILFIISGWVLFSQITKEAEEVIEEEKLITAEKYNCANDVTLNTLFMSDGESVQISLPNGRNYLLNSVESDSGFQFKSPDGGLVFSVKKDSALVKMNGEILVDGCKAVLDEDKEEDIETNNELFESSWLWKEVNYSGDENISPDNSDAFVLTLKSDGTFGASTDCNSVGGSYDYEDESNISFNDIIATEMFCEGSQETDFIEVLSLAEKFKLEEKELTLILEDNKGEASFESIELVN